VRSWCSGTVGPRASSQTPRWRWCREPLWAHWSAPLMAVVVGAADGLPGSTVGELDGLNKIEHTSQTCMATCFRERPMAAPMASVWGEQWESSSTARGWETQCSALSLQQMARCLAPSLAVCLVRNLVLEKTEAPVELNLDLMMGSQTNRWLASHRSRRRAWHRRWCDTELGNEVCAELEMTVGAELGTPVGKTLWHRGCKRFRKRALRRSQC
jgi:hypothetical protein